MNRLSRRAGSWGGHDTGLWAGPGSCLPHLRALFQDGLHIPLDVRLNPVCTFLPPSAPGYSGDPGSAQAKEQANGEPSSEFSRKV